MSSTTIYQSGWKTQDLLKRFFRFVSCYKPFRFRLFLGFGVSVYKDRARNNYAPERTSNAQFSVVALFSINRKNEIKYDLYKIAQNILLSAGGGGVKIYGKANEV